MTVVADKRAGGATAVLSAAPSTFAVATSPAAVAPRRKSLDGLRALAVLMVMAFHAGFPGMNLGWLGVDIFFVLSGFLITTLLLGEYRKTGQISLPRFWGRRFLRLMPIYWIYAACITAAIFWFDRSGVRDFSGWTPAKYVASIWTYWVNYAPMGGIWNQQHFAVHLWSLAVEEQYYFIWPVLLAALLKYTRWAEGIAWTMVAAVLLFRGAGHGEVGSHLLYTRGIGILLGSAVAISFFGGVTGTARRLMDARWMRILWLAATGLFFGLFTFLVARGKLNDETIERYFQPLACVLFAGIVLGLWHGRAGIFSRVLSWKPAVYLGQISYGMYLFHIVAWDLAWRVFVPDRIALISRDFRYGVRFLLFVGLTVGIASASYFLIERPFLRMKERLR